MVTLEAQKERHLDLTSLVLLIVLGVALITYLSAISGTPFRIILSRGRETPCFWLAREGSPAQSRGDGG